MMKTLSALLLLATLAACAQSTESSWDRQAWVDPSAMTGNVTMKSLGSPGLYN